MAEADSLLPGTELLYQDMRVASGSALRRVKVKRHESVGGLRLVVVELDDGSERSPAVFSLYWPPTV